MVWVVEAAVASDLENCVFRLFELPPYFGQADVQDVFVDGLAADLAEAEIEEAPRDADVRDDVVWADAVAGMLGNVGAGFFDKRRRRRDVDGRPALEQVRPRDADRAARRTPVAQQPVQRCRRLVAEFAERQLETGERGICVGEDERVVVASDDRHLTRDLEPQPFKDFKYFRLKIFDLPSTDIRKRL